MHCNNCSKEIEDNSKFCVHCGKKVGPVSNGEEGSVDLYFRGKENSCELCGAKRPTKQVEFYQNIGALVMRYSRSVKGRLCKKCINQYFWKYTLTTLAIGWLGVISLFVAPVFIVINVFYYLRAFNLKDNY